MRLTRLIAQHSRSRDAALQPRTTEPEYAAEFYSTNVRGSTQVFWQPNCDQRLGLHVAGGDADVLQAGGGGAVGDAGDGVDIVAG